MSILNKVKALFVEVTPEITEEKMFLKSKDGLIFSIKGKELAVDAEIMLVNEDATETVVEDGDYILEDDSTITVLAGKVTVITPKVEEAETEEVKMTIIKQVSKWAFDVDQDAIEVGTILTQSFMNEDGTPGTPLPINAGEYENEAGDKVQVDAEGKVVLITKAGAEAEALVEEIPVEEVAPVEEITVDEEMKAIKAELEALKLAKENSDKELKMAKEAFDKLKATPATNPLDTRKFEKAEGNTNTKKESMLDRVRAITSK